MLLLKSRKGTLEVGKLADFVVLSDDIRTKQPINIPNVKILNTYIGGQLLYSSHK
jgi:predicted amidohydrolase YtcJ